MAQGFKRTGNAFSTKKASSASSSSGSNKIRKGARVIAPKKTAAMAKANLTHKLTAQLNRRAESALITRLGGNREGSLKLVRADSQIVEEIKAKKAKKEAGRNFSAASTVKKDSDEPLEKSESLNSLSLSALQQLNEQESFEAEDSETEHEQE